MKNGAPNLAQVMMQHPGVPPLDVQMQQACEAAISEALKKYGCRIIYRQEFINGRQVGEQFAVIRSPSAPQLNGEAAP